MCARACMMCIAKYDNNILPMLIMIILKIIILYFIQIRHIDDFPSTGTRLVHNNETLATLTTRSQATGEPQTMGHLLCCRLLDETCFSEDCYVFPLALDPVTILLAVRIAQLWYHHAVSYFDVFCYNVIKYSASFVVPPSQHNTWWQIGKLF